MFRRRPITVVSALIVRAEPARFRGWWMFARWRVGRRAVVDDHGHAIGAQRRARRAWCVGSVTVRLYGETPPDGVSVADACARAFGRVQPGAAAPRPIRPIAV